MEEFKEWLVKIGIPSVAGISMKLAIVLSKNGKLSWFDVIVSFVTGIAAAFLLSDMIMKTIPEQYTSACIAMVAMSGEKVGLYLIYKFNVENLIKAFINGFKNGK